MQCRIILMLFFGFLAACGGSTGNGDTVKGVKLAEAQVCIGCHATNTSPGTGEIIQNEWKASVHNTKDGASCRDCHEPVNHPNQYCSKCHNGGQTLGDVDEIQRNPDKAGKCLKCHNALTYPHSAFNPDVDHGQAVDTRSAHFNNVSSSANPGVYPGSYVTYNYTDPVTGKANKCRACHNPHNTTAAMDHNRDFARNAHGMTERFGNIPLVPSDSGSSNDITQATGYYDSRIAAREEVDFKSAGSWEVASKGQSDNTNGSSRGCVRCHTTTGYINYVSSGFTSVVPFGPINPTTGRPYTLTENNGTAPASSGKEMTNCNACHDNGAGTSYDWRKLRKVSPVTVYYNYSTKSGVNINGKITNYAVIYPDAGDSNMCIPCHAGRLIGTNIKMAAARGLDFTKAGVLRSHYRATAQLMYRTGGFEFYSSSLPTDQSLKYGIADPDDHYSHKDIGMPWLPRLQTWLKSALGIDRNIGINAGDSRSHGPCIGCHMNANGTDGSSHTFLPVNREAGANYRPGYPWQNDPARQPNSITKVTSLACRACHGNGNGWAPGDLQVQKTQYGAAAIALRELMLFSFHTIPSKRTFDGEGRPAAPANWHGVKIDGSSLGNPATVDQLQSWLRCSTPTSGNIAGIKPVYFAGKEFIYPTISGDSLSDQLLSVQTAAFNMGSYWNWWMAYADPGGFAHNDVYIKRLMYDAMDWLDDGVLNQSVKDTFDGKTVMTGAGGEIFSLKTRLDSINSALWNNARTYLIQNDGEDNPGRPVP